MRTGIETTVASALQQLAFSKSTPSCSYTHLDLGLPLHSTLPVINRKLSLGHAHCSLISASITFGLFPTSQQRFNAHGTVAAQRFSSIHF